MTCLYTQRYNGNLIKKIKLSDYATSYNLIVIMDNEQHLYLSITVTNINGYNELVDCVNLIELNFGDLSLSVLLYEYIMDEIGYLNFSNELKHHILYSSKYQFILADTQLLIDNNIYGKLSRIFK